MTAVRIGRGTSLNERQPLVGSVTVESAPVKWAREILAAHRVVVPINWHQAVDYRGTSKPVKIHFGPLGPVVADVAVWLGTGGMAVA